MSAQMNMDSGLTPAQGRVVFHQERLFRSAGGRGMPAHATYLDLCREAGLPILIGKFDRNQCVIACRLIERACRTHQLHLTRDVRTGWEQLLQPTQEESHEHCH
jgi:hypothetical protein